MLQNPIANKQDAPSQCIILKPLLVEQLKRFWALPVIAMLLLSMVLIPIFTETNRDDSWVVVNGLSQIFHLNNGMVLFLLLFLPLAAVFCTMTSLFSKREMNALYSMPATKSAIHLTNALAGMILTLIPIAVFCLVLLIPIEYTEPAMTFFWGDGHMTFADWNFQSPIFPGDAVVEGSIINTPPAVLILFTRMALAALFNFAVYWLAFSLSGHGIISFLLSGAIPVLILSLPTFINAVVSIYVYGAPTFDAVFSRTHMGFGLPAILWSNFVPPDWGTLATHLVVFTIVMLIVAACAFFICQKRRAENTGNSVMFNSVKNILIFFLSLSIGILCGAILWSINNTPFWFYLGFFGGFVLGYFISQMIAEKTFDIFGKTKGLLPFGGTFVLLYCLFYLFTQFGMGFYVNRIPREENIRGVLVGNRTPIFWGHWRENIEQDFISSPEVIALTREVHENLIAERGNKRQNPWRRENHPWIHLRMWHRLSQLSIDYLLYDGRVFQRFYNPTPESIARTGLAELLTNSELVLHEQNLPQPGVVLGIEVSHTRLLPYDRLETHEDVYMFLPWGAHETVHIFNVTEPEDINTVFGMLSDYLVDQAIQAFHHHLEAFHDFRRLVGYEVMFVEGEPYDIFVALLRIDWDSPNIRRFERNRVTIGEEMYNRLLPFGGELDE